MSKAIVIHKTGGPEVLSFEKVTLPALQEGELLIQQTAVGINYIDVYHRTGLYPLPLPFTPGVEACGIVEDVGPGVSGFQVGDRVAYGTAPSGAYAERRVLHHKYVVSVPDEVPDDVVAGTLTKGLTAHYLVRRTMMVRPGFKVLVHAAAGGVGQLLCQWAKFSQALVIGTVGSEEKKEIAANSGCDHVINYRTEDLVSRVKEITGGEGVNVVYDSVGKDTFLSSIECLANFGLMVSYGQASGPIPPFDIKLLSPKSLFLTRPSLFNYKADRMELILSAHEVFAMVTKNHLKPSIYKRYALKDAAKAHADLEARKIIGSAVLMV